ncbi:MAG: succinate dehydrogenase [Bacteroidetes bacterium CG12_big_fil_rev_8_21_14_0_65_60_17]|nr:MAG: succinate dehydrogenase [Bacteroidetes bacterium CG12_big_fil_rev_8_21_14_0_65_60_17]
MSSSSAESGWLSSPILKKVVTGVTGLGLTLFVLGHMIGNLTMFSGPDAYNQYAHFLVSLGPLFYAVEIGLLAFFVFHIITGIRIAMGNRRARRSRYAVRRTAGGPSRQTVASRSMIITGLLLMAFLVIHLLSFKFGPGGPGNANAAYFTTVDGVGMRDLAKLVHEKFQTPWYTFGYTIIMLLLMLHLRHGVWSALQSLGAMRPSLTPVVYTIGGLLGAGIAAGFIVMPLAIYFGFI